MIKIVSFIAFMVAFVWTWFSFNSDEKISQATHASIQSKLMLLIEQAVKTSKPNSKNFEILNIYTEKIDDNQVSAHFSYKFIDQIENNEPVIQTMKGEAVLYRGLSENPDENKWIAKSITTNNTVIEFQEALLVNPEAAAIILSGDTTNTPSAPEEKKTH